MLRLLAVAFCFLIASSTSARAGGDEHGNGRAGGDTHGNGYVLTDQQDSCC